MLIDRCEVEDYLEVCKFFKEEIKISFCNIVFCVVECLDNGIYYEF